MTSTWSHERDKQLLVAILAVHSPLSFSAIAKAMGQGNSSAAVKQHLYTLKARQEGTSAKSPTKDNTDKPTGRGRNSTTKTTARRKTASVTQSEKGTVVESQDEHGDESASSPTKQRKL